MRLAIVGSRTFNKRSLLTRVIQQYFSDVDCIVSGGARGADSLAKDYALHHDINYIEYPAYWDLYGKKAGYMRNKDIVNACDKLLAFWDGESKGTKHSIDLAKSFGKPIMIITYKAND